MARTDAEAAELFKIEPGPEWIEYMASEVARLERSGTPLEPIVTETAKIIGAVLEVDDLWRPVVRVLNRRCLRLVWGDGPRTIFVTVRPGLFVLEATDDRFDVRSEMVDLTWVDPMRRAMRWAFPGEAGGHSQAAVTREAESR